MKGSPHIDTVTLMDLFSQFKRRKLMAFSLGRPEELTPADVDAARARVVVEAKPPELKEPEAPPQPSHHDHHHSPPRHPQRHHEHHDPPHHDKHDNHVMHDHLHNEHNEYPSGGSTSDGYRARLPGSIRQLFSLKVLKNVRVFFLETIETSRI